MQPSTPGAVQHLSQSAPAESELFSPIEVVLRNQVLAQHALVLEGDYFQILGVGPDATGAEIAQAHESLTATFSEGALSAELVHALEGPLADIRAVLDESARLLANDELRAAYRARRPRPAVDPTGEHDRR